MTERKKMSNNSSKYNSGKTLKIAVSSLLTGALLGYIGSLFVSSKTKHKHKMLIEEKASKLKEALEETKSVQRVEKVFEEKTAEAKAKYEAIKSDLITSLAKLKGTIADIDREKYQQIVDEVLARAKQDRRIIVEESEKLKNFLEDDYKKIKKAV